MTLVLKTVAEARRWVQAERTAGRMIGLVPTMGFLHEGHLSLIRRSRQRCDRTVVSLFVNPLQFGPAEDYARYPRDLSRDLALLEREQTDALFCPDTAEMYPVAPAVTITTGTIGERLCGAFRPGHFNGVATVVAKLFHILEPHYAFFGQKDAQQVTVLRAMVRDLNFPVELEACPIVREPDGLAMSSRNVYLSPDERPRATILFRSLERARSMVSSGERNSARIETAMREMIESVPGAVIDYVSVVDPNSLESVSAIQKPVLVAVAVRFGKTRLIDNMVLGPQAHEPRM